MCDNCKGLGRISNKVGNGLELITPCSCLPDWDTVRKPQLEQILKELVKDMRILKNSL